MNINKNRWCGRGWECTLTLPLLYANIILKVFYQSGWEPTLRSRNNYFSPFTMKLHAALCLHEIAVKYSRLGTNSTVSI